jgi:hydroxymethylglutaryl-CoA lyase
MVRAYVSTVFGCPYEGEVAPERSVELMRELRAMGVYQVSLGDTIGVANPRQVQTVLEKVLAESPPESRSWGRAAWRRPRSSRRRPGGSTAATA